MVDEGWTTVEKKAPAGAGRTSGGGRPDQVGRSGANRMSGTYRTRPPRGATFCPPPLFPESQTLPLKGRGLIGDGSRARPRATRHPDRVRPAPHPPRRTHPLGAPLPRSPTEQTPPKPTTAMQATDAKMGKARARVPAAGRHPRARTRAPEGADGARPAPIRTAVSSRRVSAE